MDQTQTPAPEAAGTTVTTPQVIDETLAELAKAVPDLEIIENTSPGKQGHVDLTGKILDEWPVNNAGQRIPTETPPPEAKPAAGEQASAAPEGAAAGGTDAPVPASGGKDAPTPAETPKATAAGGTPPVSEEDIVKAREAAVRATGPQVSEPSKPPADEEPPQIDWSDEPDWSDGVAYKTEQDALDARRKYIADKSAQNARDLAEHAQRQAARKAEAAGRENAAAALQARQIEYLAQTKAALGLDDAAFHAKAGEYSSVRHPQPTDPVRAPNPIAEVLYKTRDAFLVNRAAMGLPINDHESVAEILTEQWRDMDFARAVAGFVPDTPTGGLITMAVAQMPAPVRMLRHLVSDEGKALIKQITDAYGDGRKLNDQAYAAVFQDVGSRLMRADAGLSSKPPRRAPKKAADVVGKEQGAPGRFTAATPDAPRNAPGAPAAAGNEHEPFSEAWIAAEIASAKAAAAEAIA